MVNLPSTPSSHPKQPRYRPGFGGVEINSHPKHFSSALSSGCVVKPPEKHLGVSLSSEDVLQYTTSVDIVSTLKQYLGTCRVTFMDIID